MSSKPLDRHPASARFHELLAEIAELHDRKQQDYGSDTDPFANVRASERWGISGWVGALVRLNDKVARLQAFARKGVLANESADDSMRDIAVYALIALVLYEEASAEGDDDNVYKSIAQEYKGEPDLGPGVYDYPCPPGATCGEDCPYHPAAATGPYAAEEAVVYPYTPDMHEHSEGQDHLGMELHGHNDTMFLHAHDADHRIVTDRSA